MEQETYPCQVHYREDGPTLEERLVWLLEQRGREELPWQG